MVPCITTPGIQTPAGNPAGTTLGVTLEVLPLLFPTNLVSTASASNRTVSTTVSGVDLRGPADGQDLCKDCWSRSARMVDRSGEKY